MSYPAVISRPSTVGKLARITQDQWGLVTRRQAEQTGISRATFTRLVADGSVLERVAPAVYRLVGGAPPDHLALRAAWLQLDPSVPAWERHPDDGVVSHRSAAAVYGVGHLLADVHEFTLPRRRQSRRHDVRLHQRRLRDDEWVTLHGLPVNSSGPRESQPICSPKTRIPRPSRKSSPTQSGRCMTTPAALRMRSPRTPLDSDCVVGTGFPSCNGCSSWLPPPTGNGGWMRHKRTCPETVMGSAVTRSRDQEPIRSSVR